MFSKKKINRVVKYFVFADLLLFAGWGFVSPIFSVFVVEAVDNATLFVAGASVGAYWFARALVQPFVAVFIDKRKGEKDDLYLLTTGLTVAGLAVGSLAFVSAIPELFAVQLIHGAGMGLYSVAWPSIFSRHLDKGKVAFDWAFDRATLGFSTALSALAGGLVAGEFGFPAAFLLAGLLALLSALIVFLSKPLLLPAAGGGEEGHVEASGGERHKPRMTH